MWQKTNTYSFFNKVVNRLDQLRAKGYQSTWANTRKFMCYLLLRKSDERRFLQVGGRISQCLAAKHRSLGCEAGRSTPDR